MAITPVNVANSQATGATQIVHTLPASLATGDVVVVGVSASGSTDLTFSEPGSTWIPVADLYSDDGRDTNFGVFLKVMGAVPDTDVTISVGTTANLGAVSTAKRGVDTTTPLDVASVTATGINTPDADPGSITPVTNGAEVIVLGSWGRADGTITFPSGYTNTTSRQVAGGGTACALGSKNIATAGPEDPGIFDLSTGDTSDAWTAVTIALRPAGGGGEEFEQEVTAGVAGSAAITKSIGKAIGTGLTVGFTVLKAITSTIATAVTAATSADAQRAFLLTVTATLSAGASLVRSILKVVAAPVSAGVMIVRAMAKTVMAQSTAMAVVNRGLGVVISAVVSAAASAVGMFVAAGNFVVNLTANVGASTTVRKSIGLAIAVAISVAAILAMLVPPRLRIARAGGSRTARAGGNRGAKA